MKDFSLALVQQCSLLGCLSENLEAAERWAMKARAKGADLLCFPELNLTGHGGHPLMIRDSEHVPGGAAVTRLTEIARRTDLFICAGIAEEDRRATYNTQVMVGPDGYIGKQRKVHLSRDEYLYFRAGSTFQVFDLPFARVAVLICFDNEIVESARTAAVLGAEVLLAPHAMRMGPWPTAAAKRRVIVARAKEHFRLVHRCRARDNGVYVGLCNAAGQSAPDIRDCDANHAGGCLVVATDGSVLAESRARDVGEEMVVVKLLAKPLEQRRLDPCFTLRVRRPDAYGPLTERTD